MIIKSAKYDVEGIVNEEELGSWHSDERYLHFLEWLDKTGYYRILEGCDIDGMISYHVLNRTGEYDYGDGCAEAKVAEPVSIGAFTFHFRWGFSDYIKEHYVIDYIPLIRKFGKEEGWYKFTKFEPEKWLNEFIEIEIKRLEERERQSMIGQQLDLF